jgi:hypothetical protein
MGDLSLAARGFETNRGIVDDSWGSFQPQPVHGGAPVENAGNQARIWRFAGELHMADR